MKYSYLGMLYIALHGFLDVMFYTACKFQNSNIKSLVEEVIFVLVYNLKSLVCLCIFFIAKIIIKRTYIIPKNIVNQKTFLLYFLMSLFSVLGFVTFLYGLDRMLIANAMSIKYSEQIFWIATGVFVFKEKLTSIQLIGIFISMGGILSVILMSLKSQEDLLTYSFPFFAAICWSISSNIGKYLMKNINNILKHMINYYFFHTIILMLFLIFIIDGQTIFKINYGTYEFLFHIISMTFFYKALKISNISLLAPFVYIKLPISALIGYFVFFDVYNVFDLLSYSLIILGGLIIFKSLSVLNNKRINICSH